MRTEQEMAKKRGGWQEKVGNIKIRDEKTGAKK